MQMVISAWNSLMWQPPRDGRYMQMVISAWNSALRGGRLFSDALFALLAEKDWMKHCPEWLVSVVVSIHSNYMCSNMRKHCPEWLVIGRSLSYEEASIR